MILHPYCFQVSMKPKSISSGFVTALDRRILREPKSLFCRFDFLLQSVEISRVDGAFSWFLPQSDLETQNPFRGPKLKCHKQCLLFFVILFFAGRFLGHSFFSFDKSF